MPPPLPSAALSRQATTKFPEPSVATVGVPWSPGVVSLTRNSAPSGFAAASNTFAKTPSPLPSWSALCQATTKLPEGAIAIAGARWAFAVVSLIAISPINGCIAASNRRAKMPSLSPS